MAPTSTIRWSKTTGAGGIGSMHQGIRWWKRDRKSTRLNSSHSQISYAVFCLKKKISHLRANISTHTVGRQAFPHARRTRVAPRAVGGARKQMPTLNRRADLRPQPTHLARAPV